MMARLNEEFNLNFHEVNSSIHIGFGEDEAALHVEGLEEIVPIPIQFEESTSRIPVNIADKEQIPAIFGDAVIISHGESGDYYTKEETDELLDEKVDKIEGKGLSTNDLTNELVEEIHSGHGHQEIRIFTDYGILTGEQARVLKQSSSNYINYLGQIYKLRFKSSNIYKYFSTDADVNKLPMITVDFTTNSWQCDLIVNGILSDHINDNDRHVRPGERAFWNNKINCQVVENELILNHN